MSKNKSKNDDEEINDTTFSLMEKFSSFRF